jgi:hypothetical protein
MGQPFTCGGCPREAIGNEDTLAAKGWRFEETPSGLFALCRECCKRFQPKWDEKPERTVA